MNYDLFEELDDEQSRRLQITEGALRLTGFARSQSASLIETLDSIFQHAPLRHMITPGGHSMSVAMTNCGRLGWVSDHLGYRYQATDPDNGQPWPAMPESFLHLAQRAAATAGFAHFFPDACLINCYAPGTRLTLHQDKNERDRQAPVVSVSLGLPATFLFGGLRREQRPQRLPLCHGDAMVWGGPARFCYHGIAPLADGNHPLLGRRRISLTFRKAD